MELSIIIVNYNVRPFLEQALIAVQKAVVGLRGEVIVVDNASDDGSVEMIRQRFPDVGLMVNERNVGFAAANNQALRACRGEFVLLLNPDTVVQEDTFRVMIEFFRTHPDAGLAGCKVLNPDGTLQPACRRSFPTPWVAFTKISGLSTLFPKSSLFAKYNLSYRDANASYEVDAISGSFMFARRSVVEHVGGLDEQFFMYGEDLDWCFRIKQAGWNVYYVHQTQIIHYKGESVRRSELDEVRLFYEAMRVFVRKHVSHGAFTDVVLRFGIAMRQWMAAINKISRPMRAVILDVVLVGCASLLGQYVWFGEAFHFPAYAYPVTLTAPALIIVAAMFAVGVYTTHKLSVVRTLNATVIGLLIISALTFFFKQYGFSRMVVLISGLMTLVALPGWRLIARARLRSPQYRRKSLFGRRTLIVGADTSGQEVLRRLRGRMEDGYDIIGFIDLNRKRVGELVGGVEILGSIDNIGKVISEHRASEIIFSTDVLSYSDILAIISRTRNRSVNYRLVPSSLEVIIGKTHIDELGDIPLVDIEYNINKPMNRFLKRAVDLGVSLLLLILAYPFVWIRSTMRQHAGTAGSRILRLPDVLRGRMSLVGPPAEGRNDRSPYLGKAGLTGLVQINSHRDLSPEEIERYNLYYAKNQSLLLDIEIMIKSLVASTTP
jgi:GT2 family glycosyltransferase